MKARPVMLNSLGSNRISLTNCLPISFLINELALELVQGLAVDPSTIWATGMLSTCVR